MVDSPASFEDLVAHAHRAHVVVIGGGIGGLVAALECAKVGIRVTVLEASDRLGGLVRSADVAGMTLDVGAESFATRGGHVRTLVEEVGLGDDIVPPDAAGAWLAGLPGRGAHAEGRGARHPREPVRRGRAGDHRVERRVARIPRSPSAGAHDRPGAQPRPSWCAPGWVSACSTGSSLPSPPACTRPIPPTSTSSSQRPD